MRTAAGERLARMRDRYAGSSLERLWHRLDEVEFMDRGLLFAAILLLCFVPFMIVMQAVAGRSTVVHLAQRFGLDHDAAQAVSHVFTSPTATSNAVTGMSWLFVAFGGLAAASALQELYERVFGLSGRGLRDLPRRAVWVAALLAFGAVIGWALPSLHSAGGPVLVGAVVLVGATGFWWFSMWLLLAGRRAWRDLFPSAVATGICWLGMDVVFRTTMSGTITADYAKYGPIGVVFAIMSFLIATGIVVILGAIVGALWQERRAGRRARRAQR